MASEPSLLGWSLTNGNWEGGGGCGGITVAIEAALATLFAGIYGAVGELEL